MIPTPHEQLDSKSFGPTPAPVDALTAPSTGPSPDAVRRHVARLGALEERMRAVPVFLRRSGERTREINPDYLDVLLEQARVVAALRAVRRIARTSSG